MSSAQYEVVRQFKYNGKIYKKGDTWTPGGFQRDEWLESNQKFVIPLKSDAQRKEERDAFVKSQQEKHDRITGKEPKEKAAPEAPPKPKPRRKARKKKK